MKHIVSMFLLGFVSHVYADNIEYSMDECAQIYVGIDRAGGKINAVQASSFLSAINCSYFNTAEGGEFGSELIMIVLENSPGEFLSAFDKLNVSLQEKIIAEVESPIHDGFDLNHIYAGVTNTETRSTNKSRILNAIKSAAQKQHTEIK